VNLITDTVDLISADVVARLAAASFPALVDGGILIGDEYPAEQMAPPRVLFVPIGSSFPPKDTYAANATDRLAEAASRSLITDAVMYEVHCWAARPIDSTDTKLDYSACAFLYQMVIRSILLIAPGSNVIGAGKWTKGARMNRDGREFVFQLTLLTPVVEQTLLYAPSNTTVTRTTVLNPNDGGSPETGCGPS
jgi:hypothetical protein